MMKKPNKNDERGIWLKKDDYMAVMQAKGKLIQEDGLNYGLGKTCGVLARKYLGKK